MQPYLKGAQCTMQMSARTGLAFGPYCLSYPILEAQTSASCTFLFAFRPALQWLMSKSTTGSVCNLRTLRCHGLHAEDVLLTLAGPYFSLAPTLPIRETSCIRLNCALEHYLPPVFCACQSLPMMFCNVCVLVALGRQYTTSSHKMPNIQWQKYSANWALMLALQLRTARMGLAFTCFHTIYYANIISESARQRNLFGISARFLPSFRLYTRNIRETNRGPPKSTSSTRQERAVTGRRRNGSSQLLGVQRCRLLDRCAAEPWRHSRTHIPTHTQQQQQHSCCSTASLCVRAICKCEG